MNVETQATVVLSGTVGAPRTKAAYGAKLIDCLVDVRGLVEFADTTLPVLERDRAYAGILRALLAVDADAVTRIATRTGAPR